MYLSSNHLRLFNEEVKNKCEDSTLTNRADFKLLLQEASGVEKCLIAKHFCALPWNLGSLRVLSVLQQLRILTASEFVLSSQDVEQTQLILNDFLEDEYELIANLFVTAAYDTTKSVHLGAVLDECLRRLYADLCENSNLNDLDYLEFLKRNLPSDALSRTCQKHINILLELHTSNHKEAFRCFSSWINEGVDSIKFTKDLYEKLLRSNEVDMLSYLFKLSTSEHFKEWKFYLILLQTIASRCVPETSAHIRAYLKSRLRQIAAHPAKAAMAHLLLTARAATATSMDVNKNINAYADWYKLHIVDMKFVLRTHEFQDILGLLEACVGYELEKDYLEIHSTISISPPVMCRKLVIGYKRTCKMRLSQLRNNNGVDQPNESIIIEDEDSK